MSVAGLNWLLMKSMKPETWAGGAVAEEEELSGSSRVIGGLTVFSSLPW
jgi:hypothetical protein